MLQKTGYVTNLCGRKFESRFFFIFLCKNINISYLQTTAVKEFPQGTSAKSQILLHPETNQDENKKQSLVFPCSTEKVISSR